MKRLLCMIVIALLVLAAVGCAPSERHATLREMLARTVQSSKFARTVTLRSGDLLLAEEICVYSRDENGAELSYTRTTLTDDVTAQSLYQSTEYTATITETSYESAAQFFFDETAASVREEADGTVVLSAADPAAFLRMQNAEGIRDAVATVSFEFERPTACRVTFTLPSGHSVDIACSFSY